MKNSKEAVMKRQTDILTAVQQSGEITVEKLAEMFQISVITVRRDLQLLEQQNLLKRVHGGAVSREKADALKTPAEIDVDLCRKAISKYASRFIGDGSRIFINGSMTALDMLDYTGSKKVHVFTNNGRAIDRKFSEGVTITLTGGELRYHVFVGEYVMKNILELRADNTFIGCASVYANGEFCYDIPTEIGINEAMISRTRGDLYVLADHTKLKRNSDQTVVYGGCVYADGVTLITDDKADPMTVASLRRSGVRVILVPTA